jgi:hypothetical protein
VPQISSVSEDQKWLAVNSIPVIHETLEIPLAMRVPENGNLTIEIHETIGELQHHIIHLIDQKLELVHKLNGQPYTFEASPDDDPERFLLKFANVGVEDVDNYNESINIYTHNNSLYLNSSVARNASVEIFNVTGQQVYGKQITMDGLTQINPNLRTGWYVVKVSTDEGMASEKVFIK